MTYIKHNEVPKVIGDLLQQILIHPEFNEFMIDPKDLEDNAYPHPWYQEKYLCILDNPIVFARQEKRWEEAIIAAKTEKERDAVPDIEDCASLDFRKMVGRLERLLMWWLSDDDTVDDHYINLERVAAFNKKYPELSLVPERPLVGAEPWYSDHEETQPVIRTPKGLLHFGSDVMYNEIQLNNVDWAA